jgi:hypothetical protein
MPIEIVKETIELPEVTCDANGSVYLQKRINLPQGKRHSLQQTDLFEDTYPNYGVETRIELVVAPYPSIPTNMEFIDTVLAFDNRLPSAGDDSVLFKANGNMTDLEPTAWEQFPSLQIAANQKTMFYSDHIYITVHMMSAPDTVLKNVALSFMFVLESKNVSSLEHGIGVLAESHNAMCALVMSNGHMISRQTLRGNVFPMWRYGGIRPEHTITPTAANAYFLPINTRDAETMTTTPGIRQAVADARSMSPFDSAFGDKRPDWLKDHLNPGIVAGPVRDQWPPIKHADNGNVRML